MKHRLYTASAVAVPMALLLMAGTAFAAPLYRSLDVGATGSDVSDLQTFLALDASIYPQALVTGYFGALTQAAVSRFQAKNGIDVVGRVGPITRVAINAQMGGNSTDTSTIEGAGKQTNYGFAQPVLSNIIATPMATSAMITWNSNVLATPRVMYSTTWPFAYAAAASVTGSGNTNTQSVTIPNLQSNTTYYYVVESLDGNGNFTWSTNGPSFKTNQ